MTTNKEEEKIGSLEDEALKRKERLKALKRKQEDSKGGDDLKPSQPLPKPKFRSYVPVDDTLKESSLPAAKPGNVEEEVKDQLQAANTRVVIEELDLSNLAPRKPDWDLKRDVAKKLERLEKRTQRAIAELIRDRLKKGQEDWATKVAIGAKANRDDVDDD
ncbi:LOW QUALITY PROTEIN: coiled-coil domain-containing protein 12 [Nilaparvata lugens]|uniref:LOW QUALITY PROTEIN: coiled-coil domain-containing protein 12 n=1 Tax=Nilaparvata lugens TaxID=108931 RepID=UPI000B996417|nr:LOW QUALITY PROTEIN: coiled-coil domain-containing protein 12 [Nilaparvata lugens]